MLLDDDSPRVVISLPCPFCGAAAEPDPACAACDGRGIVLRRVPPEQAARDRSAGTPPRPGRDAPRGER